MATPDFFVPSGEGKKWAPVGSEEWAKNMRLRMTTMVKGLNDEPERFARYLALFTEHRGWTLLADKRGKRFATWDAFCQEPQPHGLGKPAAEVQPFMVAAVGEKKAALMTVAPDGRADNGRKPQAAPPVDSTPEEGNQKPHAAEERHRAILRAPSEVQRLYCDDLVSQKLAASLGPVKQTPEKAAKIREAVNEAVAIVDAKNPLDPEARRAVKKEVDAKIRAIIGSPVETKPKTFGDLLARIARLSSEDQASLVCEVVEHLDEAHLHRVREALDERTKRGT